MVDRAFVAATTLACLLGASGAATARVQDYQIVRLITFKSECQIARLENRSPITGPLRYVASCENVSFYPDGIEVVCADRDDDRSCRVTTKARSFDQLQLLVPRK